jgi:hypothetical protein
MIIRRGGLARIFSRSLRLDGAVETGGIIRRRQIGDYK